MEWSKPDPRELKTLTFLIYSEARWVLELYKMLGEGLRFHVNIYYWKNSLVDVTVTHTDENVPKRLLRKIRVVFSTFESGSHNRREPDIGHRIMEKLTKRRSFS